MRISLIGTYHAERGAVAVSELLSILERIQPEVVFAEIPQTHIDKWRDGTLGTVESKAVARYADTHSIEVVSVDSPVPEESFFRAWEEVVRNIERRSPTFRLLMDRNTHRTHEEGFAYLNSVECIQAWDDIRREQLETIEYIGISRIRDTYVQVRDWNESRELEMLANIRSYCASAARTSGVFLVGASHRGPLIEKIRATTGTAVPYIEWDTVGSQIGSRA